MSPIELRRTEDARRFLLHGLLRQSVQPPRPASVGRLLEWCLEAAVEGVPLPPPGFVADVGHLAFHDADEAAARHAWDGPEVLPRALLRQYEDQVLGKFYADASFERGVDGLARFTDPRDRAKGLAFLLQQIGRRAGYRGVLLSPAVIKELRRPDPLKVIEEARHSWADEGPLEVDYKGERTTLLEFLYRDLVAHVRNVGELLGAEDVFELEHGTALAGFGQRFALRQTLVVAAELQERLPRQPVRPLVRKQEVATRILDEDTYPIGGFSSISNRGSIESLLHSQLAFMEPDAAERPDMFDIKFLRDELLYYSRDENQFFRRRRTFAFALYPDLAHARVKDVGLKFQRVVMLQGLLVAAVRTLTEWLSEDSLLFELLFLTPEDEPARTAAPVGKTTAAPIGTPLADERELFAMLFREQIENGTVRIADMAERELPAHAAERGRRSVCHLVTLSVRDRRLEPESALLTRLRLHQARPAFAFDDDPLEVLAAKTDNPTDSWAATLERLLAGWIG